MGPYRGSRRGVEHGATVPKADAAAITGVPAVLTISSGIWLVAGAVGAVRALMGLLMVMVLGGMVSPETYLPALALYLAGGALSVAGVVFAVLLKRGRRVARIVLSVDAVIFPAFLYYPYFLGGPSAVEMPWREVLISPLGAVVAVSVLATVFMWLPPANAYFANRAARVLETPDGSEPPADRAPAAVLAAVWILVSPALSPRWRQLWGCFFCRKASALRQKRLRSWCSI